jgi:DNA-binding LacI/PurR family transcriptional regulator
MSKVDGISQVILTRIRTNTYTEKIPGERALAAEFGVDFKTANRAISQLVEQGTLIRRRGLGTFVAPVHTRRDLTIGLCFFKFSDPGRDPVFNRFFAGMNRESTALGLRLDVTALADVAGDPPAPLDQQIARFRQQALGRNPDGLIYLGNINTQLIELLRADRPTIVVAQTPDSMQFDTVRRDVAGGIAAAVQRFYDLGHRHIALATYQHSDDAYDLAEKERGYDEICSRLGLTPQVMKVTYPAGKKLAQLAADTKPRATAVVCAESTLGLSLIGNASEVGLTIPDDIAIAAFDDGEAGQYTQPSLTSILAFGEELAHHAMTRLIDKLDGRATERICEILPCPMIERNSTGSPR